MERKASCSCKQLKIVVRGDPRLVATCNCLECQSKTGSVFGVSSYFDDEQVLETVGESRVFETSNDIGRKIRRHFCPNCGTTVYWKAEIFSDKTGIAVGCFSDPNFPEPTATVWTSSKHSWVNYPKHWSSSETQELGKANG